MYTLQIARLDRMYKFVVQDERFKNLDDSLKIDIILSFFMHCYHLKDWLVESGIDKKKVEGYINNSYELKICQKLTNSTKHLSKPDSRPPELFDWKSAAVPSPISRSYDPFARNQEESIFLVISIDGKEHRCSDFMHRCMEKWNEFLDNERLEREVT